MGNSEKENATQGTGALDKFNTWQEGRHRCLSEVNRRKAEIRSGI